MRKSYTKLIASGFLTLIAIILMVTVSYAWVTLSGAPALTGVQINIGGSNTIKIAPDVSTVVDGKTVHYPGKFEETFNVADDSNYDYLNSLAGLTPVSTADGIHWFMPSEDSSMEVKGESDLSEYVMDRKLSHANLTTDSDVNSNYGSYAYIDFWLVSPMEDCDIRVSIGSADEGSYLIGLPEVEEDASSETGFSLKEVENEVAACARVGFLVNTNEVSDNEPMELYCASDAYSSEYKKLRGIYQEPGNAVDPVDYQFTIYEPNGDLHSNKGVSYIHTEEGLTYVNCEDGDYVITRPIGYEDGSPVLADVSDILTVQKTNKWKASESEESLISQIFQSTMINQNLSGLSAKQVMKMFYQESWMNRYSDYVDRASFIENVNQLYFAGDGEKVTKEELESVSTSTTTKDAVIVNLQRNVPQKIRMYVWLEGQDVDCVREAAMDYFAVGIELAGSTQK